MQIDQVKQIRDSLTNGNLNHLNDLQKVTVNLSETCTKYQAAIKDKKSDLIDIDPHFWLDIGLVKKLIIQIGDALDSSISNSSTVKIFCSIKGSLMQVMSAVISEYL